MTYRLTIYLESGMKFTSDVTDPEAAKKSLQTILDNYYKRWFRTSSWAFVHGQPYFAFPIEKMIAFSIEELNQ